MKIVHTYLPLRDTGIDKLTIYQMTLSVLLAKKYYDKVVLYTNVITAKIVREIGLPYDEVDDQLLEGVETQTFSIPKLIVYADQTEPYVHIDLDTFLFKKIEFNELYKIYSSYNEGNSDMMKINIQGFGFYNTYLNHTVELKDKLPFEFTEQIDFGKIPNMSIFGGYHYELIAKASSYCLDIYEKNRDHFHKSYYNACIIEQLFIPTAIKMIIKTDEKYRGIKFSYLYDKSNPSQFRFLPDKDFDYPFEIESNNEKIVIENDVDLYSRISYNFNGFLHLCGYKNFDKIIYIIRSKILFDMKGANYLNIINNIFPERYPYEMQMEHYDEMKKIVNKKKNFF